MSVGWNAIRQWNKRLSRQCAAGDSSCLAEAFSWLFVGFIPLLYEKKKVARQLQVETWLDLSQLVKELRIEKLEAKQDARLKTSYIV